MSNIGDENATKLAQIVINDFNKASKVAQQTLFMMAAILDLL